MLNYYEANNKISIIVCLYIILLFIPRCTEKNTSEPIETYTLWSGEIPPKDVKVIHGKYWQSSHWSKEYIMYLEVDASSFWRRNFIKQNNLFPAGKNKDIPSGAPEWFKPTNNFRTLIQTGSTENSRYYEDTINGKLFIYEIQL